MSAAGYQLHPDATKELDAAGEWYDAQLLGLSLELFDAVEEAIALILERPAAWPRDSIVAGRDIRRFVMRRFPFSIVYYVVDDLVRIVALAHAKRKTRLLASANAGWHLTPTSLGSPAEYDEGCQVAKLFAPAAVLLDDGRPAIACACVSASAELMCWPAA